MENNNPTNMYGVVETIDTERAEELLRKHRVDLFAEVHLEGKWVLTHQGIALNTKGELIDGQHRLRMIIQSGKSATLFVVYNVPDSALLHIDDQLPRSVQDALRMMKKGNYSCSLLAVAGGLETYPETGNTGFRSREDYVRILQEHPDKLDFAERHARAIGITRGVRTVVARAYPHVDRERLLEWCAVLKTGMPVRENAQQDSAAITYRNFLMRAGRSTGGTIETEKYRKGQMALETFCELESCSKIYGTERDLFPLVPDRPANA